MFEPPVALASLSGTSTSTWALRMDDLVGAAFLGGIALDEPTQAAARELVARGRSEFLPPDPIAFIDRQLTAMSDSTLVPGYNVRAVDPSAIRAAATVCRAHDAILEINAHCRQPEMCLRGTGERLLQDPERLTSFVATAAESGATVSVKVRAEVPGVELPALAERIERAGATCIHVDAMDTESIIQPIRKQTDLFIVANNEVRDARTTHEYLAYGADAVSVGRASDDPAVLQRVVRATETFRARTVPRD